MDPQFLAGRPQYVHFKDSIKKMKILTVAFMLLFNYLDTLPKLYTVVMIITCVSKKKYLDWEYSVTCLVTSPKVHGVCGYDWGRGLNFKFPQQNWPIA